MSCFISGDVSILKNKLDKNHVLYTFIEEHESILNLLDKLEIEANIIKDSSDYDSSINNIKNISELIEKVISAESHHKREEDVLFVILQDRGFIQPPRVMLWEHERLREYKHNIKKFTEEYNNENFDYMSKKISFNIEQLNKMLRNHIAKENNILYPASLDIIKEDYVWENLKKQCDSIGYCDLSL